jgi:calcium-dependent protein kinase
MSGATQTAHDGFDETKIDHIQVDVGKFVTESKGSVKDRYKEVRELGRGSYGRVLLVNDKCTGEVRAMKVISKATCGNVNASVLAHEVEVLKKLDHPNIIKLYGFYQDDKNYYLITEYCSGGELFDRIIRMKTFSEAYAAKLMKQLLSAVTYCHNLKVVHRYDCHQE